MTDAPDVLIALDYYRPYVSGLTNVARDVAEGLAARGHRVQVVAGRHDAGLPAEEMLDGVHVLRTPVLGRLGKSLVSPGLLSRIVSASRAARVTNLHLPMPEAGFVAPFLGSPLVLTYQCDVSPGSTVVDRTIRVAMDASSRVAMRRAARVVVSSDDYAHHSRVWPAMAGRTVVIPPSCHARPAGRPRFRDGDGLHVGFLGRIVEEKGLQYLVRGFQQLDDPDARLLVGGDFSAVAGGSVIEEVRALVAADPRIRLLGFLPDEEVADLYASIDVFALPSVNSFEAFGIVQVEAMMAGVPVLASDLPGVRTPVQETGFGVVVAPRDVPGIAAGLAQLRAAPPDAEVGASRARDRYALETVLDAYEKLLTSVAR